MIDDNSKTDGSGFVDRTDDDDEKEEILKWKHITKLRTELEGEKRNNYFYQ